jgi:phosphoribosylanthranilate isomerase
MWVKICGTTNLEDALAAVDAGADALGFVFAESPRRVEPGVAREIVRSMPEGIEKVGVFVNETAERISEIVQQAGLTAVQLHGDESLEFANQLAEHRRLRVIPVLPITKIREVERQTGAVCIMPGPLIDTILIDSAMRDKRGGTGRTWDWGLSRGFTQAFRAGKVKVIVAGGLTPRNVRAAIETMLPWGVDVASGVEREPGKKDHEKVREFVKAAKNTDL